MHGNQNINVTIRDITFENFEVVSIIVKLKMISLPAPHLRHLLSSRPLTHFYLTLNTKSLDQAAVSVNKVDGIIIENCMVNGNRKDVPIVGLFSATRFIRYVTLALEGTFVKFYH